MEIESILVGSTGFVGGNLAAEHRFSRCYHASDIGESYGSRPELCVYAGVPAAMFLANSAPEKDLSVMRAARENIRRIDAKKTVLISTISVYADSLGKDEKDAAEGEGLSAYGANRLQLEKWVREDRPDTLIVRLPALYGKGLKKNFLFDLHTLTPSMLRADKYEELARLWAPIRGAYTLADTGFYVLNQTADKAALRKWFATAGFNALSFTDSRSRYQFYPLARLWKDIASALEQGITLINMATPPVAAAEVYAAVTGGEDWRNELAQKPYDYDMRTCYAGLFGGKDGYLCSKEQELASICEFMGAWNSEETF